MVRHEGAGAVCAGMEVAAGGRGVSGGAGPRASVRLRLLAKSRAWVWPGPRPVGTLPTTGLRTREALEKREV